MLLVDLGVTPLETSISGNAGDHAPAPALAVAMVLALPRPRPRHRLAPALAAAPARSAPPRPALLARLPIAAPCCHLLLLELLLLLG